MSDTKPCPFCGYDAELVVGLYGVSFVMCNNPLCSARGPRGTSETDSGNLWNNMQAATRKGEPVESEF